VDTSLKGKVAVVTAGASGIGLEIATTLLSEGAVVHVCDVDATALANLPDGITGARVDVSDDKSIAGWLDPIAANGVDILVNNAGIAGPTGPVESLETDAWRHCLAVCVDSQFFCTRAVVPAMKRQQSGCIINLSSTAGLMGFPLRSPYTAAKFAVVGLTQTWAMELGQDNIRVNAIAPGSVNGERIERVIKAHAESDGISTDTVRKMYASGVSMMKFIDADEIASMVVYLCSDHARSISGQIIAVDGHSETLFPRDIK